MFNSKLFLYLYLIVISFLCLTIINYKFPYVSLWLLFIIPMYSTVVLIPKWLTVWLSIAVTFFTLLSIEFSIFNEGRLNFIDIHNLLVTQFVGLILFIFISHLRITNSKLLEKLRSLALTDPLTEVYNRRYFELLMDDLLPSAQQEESPLTIIVFDIDYFKKINDTYGHNAGDIVLKRLVKLVKREIRKSDYIIRLGGEEFLITLPSSNLSHGVLFAEKIRKKVEKEPFIFERNRIPLTVSMGVTQYKSDQTIAEFLNNADVALYRAKKGGRNKTKIKF